MRDFLRNYYSDFQTVAVKNSEEYQMRKNSRYEMEAEIELKLEENGLHNEFERYCDLVAEEIEVLMEAVYLLGAEDREKMLKGII